MCGAFRDYKLRLLVVLLSLVCFLHDVSCLTRQQLLLSRSLTCSWEGRTVGVPQLLPKHSPLGDRHFPQRRATGPGTNMTPTLCAGRQHEGGLVQALLVASFHAVSVQRQTVCFLNSLSRGKLL